MNIYKIKKTFIYLQTYFNRGRAPQFLTEVEYLNLNV